MINVSDFIPYILIGSGLGIGIKLLGYGFHRQRMNWLVLSLKSFAFLTLLFVIWVYIRRAEASAYLFEPMHSHFGLYIFALTYGLGAVGYLIPSRKTVESHNETT